MKKMMVSLMTLVFAGAMVQKASAGGVGVSVAIGVPAPVHSYGYAPVYYPAPRPVVVYTPPPPVVVYRPPVCAAPRVYVAPPVIGFSFGFGHYGGYRHHFHRHGCW